MYKTRETERRARTSAVDARAATASDGDADPQILPNEVWAGILARLVDQPTALACERVCRDWREAISPIAEKTRLEFPERAAEAGHEGLLRWALREGCPLDPSVCKGAARYGRTSLIRWARRRGFAWHPDTLIAAAKGGHVGALAWLHRSGCPWHGGTGQAAARAGHVAALAWVASVQPQVADCWFWRKCFLAAVHRNRVDILEWIERLYPSIIPEGFGYGHDLCRAAAERGHVRALEWLSTRGCVVNRLAANDAMRKGQLDVLRWMRKRNIAWHGNWTECLHQCRLDGHVCVLVWSMRHVPEPAWEAMDPEPMAYLPQFATGESIGSGQIEVFRWAVRAGWPWKSGNVWVRGWGAWAADDVAAMEELIRENPEEAGVLPADAAFYGCTDALRWFRERGCGSGAPAVQAAAASGRTDVLRWLRDAGDPWDPAALYQAARHGRLDAVRWLWENAVDWRSKRPPVDGSSREIAKPRNWNPVYGSSGAASANREAELSLIVKGATATSTTKNAGVLSWALRLMHPVRSV